MPLSLDSYWASLCDELMNYIYLDNENLINNYAIYFLKEAITVFTPIFTSLFYIDYWKRVIDAFRGFFRSVILQCTNDVPPTGWTFFTYHKFTSSFIIHFTHLNFVHFSQNEEIRYNQEKRLPF